jgi:hypothetical protein
MHRVILARCLTLFEGGMSFLTWDERLMSPVTEDALPDQVIVSDVPSVHSVMKHKVRVVQQSLVSDVGVALNSARVLLVTCQ